MTLASDDRQAITDLLNLHGHLTDQGAFERMDELLTPDAVFDLTGFGLGVRTGLAAMNDAIREIGDGHPVGHHVTNIVLTADQDRPDDVRAISKGIGISADGRAGSVVYEDTVHRTPRGWRITHRTIRPRRTPLTP